MRMFEILTLLTLLGSFVECMLPEGRRPRLIHLLPLLAAAFIAIHLVIEKHRWQMVPAYGWCLLLALAGLARLLARPRVERRPARRAIRALARTGTAIGAFAFLISAALPFAFPVMNLPKPTGPYAVGTRSLEIADRSRPETLTDDPSDVRDLMVRVWYPADPAPGSKPMTYWPEAAVVGAAIAEENRSAGMTFLPRFFYNHFALARTNSFPDAPLSSAQAAYPVVLFSPGGGMVHEYNFLCLEGLASRGYIAISLSTPYESPAVVFPDGRVIRSNQPAPNPVKSQQELEHDAALRELGERFAKTEDVQESKAIMREAFELDPAWISTRLMARVADCRAMLDELARMNAGELSNPLSGRLDLDRMGILGMSLGGATAGQACLDDRRFRAGVNLDGTQFGTVIDGIVSQPFLFMNNGGDKEHNRFVYGQMGNAAYSATIAGSSHLDFTDVPFTLPILKFVQCLPIPQFSELLGMRHDPAAIRSERMRQVVDAYLAAFFDRFLKGNESPLLTGPSAEYPEVTFRIIQAPD